MGMTNLKCVKCDAEAGYLFNGTSYCKDHLPKAKPMTKEDLQKLSFPESIGASRPGDRI